MGAPKQKWTAQEESALKAGVVKHGSGRWRTILKDPEFSSILYLRSNVDLKDKWRNLSAIANGWGSREKARIALKRSQHVVKHDYSPMAPSTVDLHDEIMGTEPVAMSSDNLQITSLKRSLSKMDNLILKAITSLKEPTGADKMAIAMYIEDQYKSPVNLKRLSAKLKALTASGKLVKVHRKYRMAPSQASSERRSSKALFPEERQRELNRVESDDFKPLKIQMDSELARMRNISTQEAAAVAAQAVAEAEEAMAEAEEAAREAEVAEADAEAARVFAEAAKLTLKSRNAAKLMV